MEIPKIKLICIVGPTAVGKSDFAVEYALKNNGEIISADSRQVYVGLDIGTGKITREEMRSVPHHLLDVADPKKQFNVEQFKTLAQKAIEDISARGKLPIICGGTGFYIEAVIGNISYPNVPHDQRLRKKLYYKTAEELFKMLSKIDPKFSLSLNNSEKNNKQRLVRFIEVGKKLGQIPPVSKSGSIYDVEWIGLTAPTEILKERIQNRLVRRIEHGMVEEAKNLHANGLSWKRMEELGLEYRYLAYYLQEKMLLDKMKGLLEMEIWHYAKRQLVWFKRNKDINWIEVK